jgi:hypothetical protein
MKNLKKTTAMKATFIILLFVIGSGVIALTNARPQRAMALETSTPEKTLSSDIHNYLNVTQEEINNFITLDEYDDSTIFGIRLTAAEILLFADYPDEALLAYGYDTDAFNGQYLKISIGKGLIDIEDLAALIERYATFFPAED